jgi:hypothetical protein
MTKLLLLSNITGEGRRPVHYVDLKGQKVDKDASKLIALLRDEKVPHALDKVNVKSYDVDWSAIIGHKYVIDLMCT